MCRPMSPTARRHGPTKSPRTSGTTTRSAIALSPGIPCWLPINSGNLYLEVTTMPDAGSRRWWALGAVSLSVLAVTLDGTVLSVALPTLAKALHASESDLEWFSSGYLLLLAAGVL